MKSCVCVCIFCRELVFSTCKLHNMWWAIFSFVFFSYKKWKKSIVHVFVQYSLLWYSSKKKSLVIASSSSRMENRSFSFIESDNSGQTNINSSRQEMDKIFFLLFWPLLFQSYCCCCCCFSFASINDQFVFVVDAEWWW